MALVRHVFVTVGRRIRAINVSRYFAKCEIHKNEALVKVKSFTVFVSSDNNFSLLVSDSMTLECYRRAFKEFSEICARYHGTSGA